MQPATLNGLMAMTEKELPLSERARQLLSRETIKIRVIDSGSVFALHPMVPDSVLDAQREVAKATPAEMNRHYERKVREWLLSADPEERIKYRLEREHVKFRAIALAAVEPVLTVAQAERLGDDAVAIYEEILIFSGLAERPAPAPVAAVPADGDAAA